MNKIYFFNSAKFNFSQIDLKNKNLFFVGDNGSGKTTAIRAIHFYYNSDVRGVGIDSNKDSFKEFYFKYDNSFIVYEFDDYFVLMYKRGNEIKKLFSKQKFEIDRIKVDNKIKSFDEVIKYAKDAPIRYIAHTNEEYKKIIYGFERKYLDFKLTHIKNYETFIKLYNKIFNVNKAVFDSKGIKEIIFTTLNQTEFKEIDYNKFLNEINNVKRYLEFNKKFKSIENSIDNLYILKNSLLSLQNEINELLKKIVFRKDIEKKNEKELSKEIQNLNNLIFEKNNEIKNIEKEKEEFLEKISNYIYRLKSQISEIDRLKEKFTLIKINEAENRVVKKDEIDKKIIELEVSKNELIKGIKSQIDEIDETIQSLQREKRNLKDELKSKKIEKKRFLDEVYQNKIEEFEEEKESKNREIEKEILSFEEKKDELINQKITLQKKIDKITYKYKKLENQIKKEIEEEENNLEKQKREIKNEKDNLIEENYKLKRTIKKEEERNNEKIKNTENSYNKDIEYRKNLIFDYKNILETNPDSFQYFLNQNVENWEKELYPLIDKTLLNKTINELKPKIISQNLIGIEIDKTNLEKIPTMQEAERKIEELRFEISILEKEKYEKIEVLKSEYAETKIKIEAEIKTNEEFILQKDKEFKELNEKIEKLFSKLKNKIYKINGEKKEEENLVKQEILEIENSLKNLDYQINQNREKIKSNQQKFKNDKEKLLKEKEIEFNQIKAELEIKFIQKKQELEEKIENFEQNKKNISKDERIKSIENELLGWQKKKKEVEKAELFLKDYAEKREFINSQPKIKKELEINIDKKEAKEKEFKNRIQNLKNEIEKSYQILKELKNKKEIIENGLDELSKIEIEFPTEKIETDDYLIDLINEFKKKSEIFDKNKTKITNIASRIMNRLQNFVIDGLDVNFNLEKLSELVDEEFKKVDELYEFKNKKINTLNNIKYGKIKELLSNLLNKQIGNFEKNKDDFIKQVRKINTNLSKVNFGIVKNIKIEIEENKRDILKLFDKIKNSVIELMSIGDNETLFFDGEKTKEILDKIENYFKTIQKEISRENFSLIDVIDVKINFIENEKLHTLKEIRNESSTGGSILLKIAIAITLLELFLSEKANLFLILDEVGVISNKNQEILKNFVNERGFGVIYISPELPSVDFFTNDVNIYKFRNNNGIFETKRLILDREGISL